MRVEDKEVDGTELWREQREVSSELEQRRKDDPARFHTEQVMRAGSGGPLLAAVEAILARRLIVIETLPLAAHELRALEALHGAVEGRDHQVQAFLYASDRRELLEQALAVLQPGLMRSGSLLPQLIERVGLLRTDLKNLEDGQQELRESYKHSDLEETGGGDEPDDPEPESEPEPEPEPESEPEPEPEPESEPEPEPASAESESAASAQPDQPVKKKPWWRRPFGG